MSKQPDLSDRSAVLVSTASCTTHAIQPNPHSLLMQVLDKCTELRIRLFGIIFEALGGCCPRWIEGAQRHAAAANRNRHDQMPSMTG